MVTKTKIMGLITAFAVLSAPMVYADNGPGDGQAKDAGWHQDGDWHHGQGHMMMAKILGLSDDQVKQLKDLHKQQRDAMKGLFEQIKSNREAFDAEVVKANADMNKVTDLQNQLKTLQGQMADNHLNNLLAVKKIMTPEQFAGFMALKKERKLMMMHKMHDGFGHNSWGKDGDSHHWGDGDHGED